MDKSTKGRSLKAFEMVSAKNEPIYITYILSVMAATCSELVTFPFDLIKTRLQIQGEKATEQSRKIPHRGMTTMFVGIIKEEGFFTLWKGLTPMIYRHSIYSGIRIITYQKIRDFIIFHREDKKFPFWQSATLGAGAGIFGQFCANPADLVKVRLQVEGRRVLMGHAPRIKGANEAFVKIYRENGFVGLWKGAVPSMMRSAMVNLGDLTAYDNTKNFVMENLNLQDNWITHFLSSFVAGFVAALLCTPADMIKSRIMNQPMDSHGKGLYYKGTWNCIQKSFQDEGFFAFYKGFIPNWLRLGPWAMVFWMSYEQMRQLFGYEGF